MPCFRPVTIALVAAAVATAQQTPETQPAPDIKVTVTEILVPVTVQDRDEMPVNGLQPRQFRLFDNGKEQDIKVDVSYHPLSLVIVIQANSAVEAVLPQIRKVGSLLEAAVIGEAGEAAVLAFDHRFRLMQDFTSDIAKISEAVRKITPGSSSSRMIDAVGESVRMLRRRPANRRRIILLISETRDISSEGRARNALIDSQLANVSVYTVNISRLVTTLTQQPLPPRPDPLPPAARSMPSNVPATPTSVAQKTGLQGGSADFVPLMVEIFRDVKAIFVNNPAELFTKGTGGAEFHFYKQRGLEEAIARIGQEIHSQYMVAYSPNNREEGGFHEIKVTVNFPDVKVRTRPGYWLSN
ncbi:MAG: VWA domain-containing protein [Bryobacteraceae bacterium]